MHRLALDIDDASTASGLPATSVARTLKDAARTSSATAGPAFSRPKARAKDRWVKGPPRVAGLGQGVAPLASTADRKRDARGAATSAPNPPSSTITAKASVPR